MKKKIGVIVALSIMITGINYPTYSVYAQEENQDIFQSEENSAESDLQQENGEQTLNEEVDIDTESVAEESQEQGDLKENSWRYQDGELIRSAEDEISVISDVYAPNATKKGIDATSEVYKTVLPLMKNAMVSVLDFLKQIPQMGDKANEYRQMLCDNYERKTAMELKTFEFQEHPEKRFDAPELDMDIISQKKDTVRIAFDASKNAANAAKLHAEARSYKELGALSFEYYLQMEDIDYEES